MSFFSTALEWGVSKLEAGYTYVTSGDIFDDAGERIEQWWEGEGGDKVISAGVTGMLGLDEQGRPREAPVVKANVRSRVQPAIPQQAGPTLADMGYTSRAIQGGQRALNSQNRYIQDALNMVRPNITLTQPTVGLASATLPQQRISTKYAEQIS